MNKDKKLSPEQIEHWRRVLSTAFGPYALVMPEEEIQRYRDAMQKKADKLFK